MIREIVFLFFCLSFLCACKFSAQTQSSEPAAAIDAQQQSDVSTKPEILPVVETPYLVSVSWPINTGERGAKLIRTVKTSGVNGILSTAGAITIPAEVPESLELGLELPEAIEDIAKQQLAPLMTVSTDTAERILPIEKISMEKGRLGRSSVRITVAGLTSIFPPTEEAQALWRFKLVSPSGEVKRTVLIEVRTPPSAVTVESFSVANARDEGLKIPRAWRGISAPGFELTLALVLRVSNRSYRSLQVSVPVITSTSLTRKLKDYSFDSSKCSTTTSERERVEPLNDDSFVLPLTEALPETLRILAHNPEAITESVLNVQSNESQAFGVFVRGENASKFLKGTIQLAKPEIRQSPVKCDSVCGLGDDGYAKRRFQELWLGTVSSAAMFWNLPEWVWAKDVYGQQFPLEKVNACLACSHNNPDACNICRAWEVTSGHYYVPPATCAVKAAWMWVSYCGESYQVSCPGGHSLYPVKDMWLDVPVDGLFKYGSEDVGLSLETLEKALPQFQVRYGDMSRDDDAEARAITAFKKSIVL